MQRIRGPDDTLELLHFLWLKALSLRVKSSPKWNDRNNIWPRTSQTKDAHFLWWMAVSLRHCLGYQITWKVSFISRNSAFSGLPRHSSLRHWEARYVSPLVTPWRQTTASVSQENGPHASTCGIWLFKYGDYDLKVPKAQTLMPI